jgi:hypothetical protein
MYSHIQCLPALRRPKRRCDGAPTFFAPTKPGLPVLKDLSQESFAILALTLDFFGAPKKERTRAFLKRIIEAGRL